MSEMVERVARALCIADGYDPDDIARYDGPEVGGEPLTPVFRWLGYHSRARAAIEAMRESTEEMASAVNREFGFSDGHKSAAMLASPRVWRTMIDAALT